MNGDAVKIVMWKRRSVGVEENGKWETRDMGMLEQGIKEIGKSVTGINMEEWGGKGKEGEKKDGEDEDEGE